MKMFFDTYDFTLERDAHETVQELRGRAFVLLDSLLSVDQELPASVVAKIMVRSIGSAEELRLLQLPAARVRPLPRPVV